jgi:hypothetical protein
LIGLRKWQKAVRRVIGIQISGYDRSKEINTILDHFGIPHDEYEFFIDKTYLYTEHVEGHIGGIRLNVVYEAKAWRYLWWNGEKLNLRSTDRVGFWCIGDNNFVYDHP